MNIYVKVTDDSWCCHVFAGAKMALAANILYGHASSCLKLKINLLVVVFLVCACLVVVILILVC
jgi:hypothetical protein